MTDQSTLTTTEDIQSKVDRWLKSEENGERFPVSFEECWQIAGYKKRQDAAINIENNLIEDEEFLRKSVKNPFGKGRGRKSFDLTCDAFKHFCLLAKTEQGRQIRQYFIEAERKWRKVQEKAPELATEIDREIYLAKLNAQIARDKRKTVESSERALDKNAAIVVMHGAPMLALIQGRPGAVIREKETLTETIVCQDGRRVNFKGKSTAQAGKDLGFKSGKDLEKWLESIGESGLIAQGMRAVQTPYIPEENLEELRRLYADRKDEGDRQRIIGES